MARPNVTISKLNGGLGGTVASRDGVSLLVVAMDAAAYGGLTGTAFVGIQRSDFEAQGFTEAKDRAAVTLAWEHIKDFYVKAPAGTELHVLTVPETVTVTQLFTPNSVPHNALKGYLTAQKANIKLLGVALNPADAETGAQAGLTAAFVAALALAQAFADDEFAKFRPIDIVLEGRIFNPQSLGSAVNLRGQNAPNVSVMISRDRDRRTALEAAGNTGAANYAAVGFALGRVAGVGVEVNIGRRRFDSDRTGWLDAETSAGRRVVEMTDADLDTLSDKGYLFVTQDTGQEGFYFNDDPTCAPLDNDYCFISRNRVINKAARIARRVFIRELLDTTFVDPATGNLSPLEIKRSEDAIKTPIEDEMIAVGEALGVQVFIRPEQNILADGRYEILLRVVPPAYKRFIDVKLQLSNPANN
jgi:hypothetical protein